MGFEDPAGLIIIYFYFRLPSCLDTLLPIMSLPVHDDDDDDDPRILLSHKT